ncbi:Kinase superfamily protein [Tripterygium wilfordii]|uniref:non-specific serine/threonine protein kinase n=1 Tax=Tripterygium wilfordii TaxID=458696 RepID=A0A7J7CZA4_TRIWF|nr:probable serine/threonine-protein kinase PIX13 [Tripterygium wilfordii]KAF5739299.1 Kinase superfamily protein [Tripterygium wilfordii]
MGNNCCFRSRPVAVNHHNSDTTKSRSPETERAENSQENGGIMVGKNISESQEDVKEEVRLESEANTSTTTKKIMPSSGRILTPNLKIFTLAELKSATRNFRPDTVLGEGGFGRVFRGWVDHKTYAPSKAGVGMAVAVKKSNPDSSQGLEEWQAEVKFLGKFSHPNLVKLLGYCWEESQFLLVYEYMQKGSLENHLFRNGGEPLSWETRLKIAIEAAKGLDYLHTSEKSVIYRDFKASNILLDGAFHAKLSDFGLAKFGPLNGNSHITTRVMGTYGYAAPEYVATGHLYVKSDVYGFGVVLLEMLTGLRALDTNRPSNKHNLVEWANPSLSSKSKLKKIMDPRLEKNYPINGAMKAGELILKCLEGDPKKRPSMNDVLDDLVRISEMKEKSKERKSKDKESHQRSPIHRKHGGKDIPYI